MTIALPAISPWRRASACSSSGRRRSADDLRKAGDLGSHEYLAAELARLRPADAVLSEEAADDNRPG